MDHEDGFPESEELPDLEWPLHSENHVEHTPHWALWFPYLMVRPRVFFQHFVVQSMAWLTALTAWMYGIVGVMDRVDTRILMSDRSPEIREALGGNWPAYWLLALFGGLFSGFLYYAVGGWWYRMRLSFCGATEPDKEIARRVYIYASQAYVVPFLVYSGWETASYANPLAAMYGDDWGGFLIVAALFWSIYVSYRGVRTLFDVKPWAARIWFGLLPAVVYSLALVAVVAGLLAGFLDEAPDLRNTNRIDRPGFSLEYPGNWQQETFDEDFDPDRDFSIGPAWEDAMIHFWLYDEAMDSQACVDQTLENLTGAYGDLASSPITNWGRYAGAGYEGVVTIEGSPYEFVAFCDTERARPFEILWIALAESADDLRPGLELIRGSFELIE